MDLSISHSRTVEQILRDLDVDPNRGLSSNEAEKRQLQYGKNELPHEEATPLWKLVVEQFDDLLVKILLAAAITSFVLAMFEHGDDRATAFVEPLVILTILICNAVVGVWQESNAEKAIEALKAYQSPTATVLRNGHLDTIPAVDLVPGDIIEFAVGCMIPADSRVIELLSTTVRVDQAPLTGESLEVMKQTDAVPNPKVEIQGKTNIVFSGTTVSYGKGRGIVIGTGLKTAIGQVHKDVSETETDDSPLQKRLDEFGESLSKVIGVICIVVWLINIGHFTDPVFGGWVKGAIYYFKIAVALAVAAIPEGLPAVVTTCLALGTRKMAKKNAIVRYLPSVETLGCTTVICSDKTGTLTTNMMSVSKIVSISESGLVEYEVDDTRYRPMGTVRRNGSAVAHPAADLGLAHVALISSLCNDASLAYNAETKSYERIGEATEAALRVLVEKIGLPDHAEHTGVSALSEGERLLQANKFWESSFVKQATLEFSRDRKSMSALVTVPSSGDVRLSGKNALLVKGAPENILARSARVKLNNGSIVALDDRTREVIQRQIDSYGSGQNALRCLGFAYVDNIDARSLDLSNPARFGDYERDMVFVGLCGMLDPPRPEVKASIETCKQAGIRVIVITGDNKATAEAICRRIGVFGENEDLKGKSFTGREFDALSEADKIEAVLNANLFCRVEPSHKMKLVDLLQQQGEVCAMTGDGVNDAPALKKADIGVAMGSGTAVAKGAADMVLADDNFASIVSAVEEGRSIYNNTKQFIRYLISSNIGEVVCIFLTAAVGMPEVLVPVQLLWVNLVTDGLPATALGFNPADKRIMRERPRSSTAPIVDGWMFFRYVVIGAYVGFATVAGFGWWYLFHVGGPQISWYDLTHFHGCVEGSHAFSCSIFADPRPSTISLSVLVTIEMFNALNAVSENESIFSMPPWCNKWLMGAIATSFGLHFVILYVPFFAGLFGVAPISFDEWTAVIAFSFPIIIIDEILKFVSRNSRKAPAAVARAKKQR